MADKDNDKKVADAEEKEEKKESSELTEEELEEVAGGKKIHTKEVI